ncbi:MAG: DinB family protein [Thermoanaerobaculia bacterium]
MLEKLRTFPAELRTLLASAPHASLRRRAADGTFALIEQAWHLADLEAQGYGVRIEKMLAEDNPHLQDFKGDVVAEERRYLELELEPALRKFEEARARNVARIDALTDEQMQRTGDLEGTGRVTIARVVEMMAEHDAGHAAELRALLDELSV